MCYKCVCVCMCVWVRVCLATLTLTEQSINWKTRWGVGWRRSRKKSQQKVKSRRKKKKVKEIKEVKKCRECESVNLGRKRFAFNPPNPFMSCYTYSGLNFERFNSHSLTSLSVSLSLFISLSLLLSMRVFVTVTKTLSFTYYLPLKNVCWRSVFNFTNVCDFWGF